MQLDRPTSQGEPRTAKRGSFRPPGETMANFRRGQLISGSSGGRHFASRRKSAQIHLHGARRPSIIGSCQLAASIAAFAQVAARLQIGLRIGREREADAPVRRDNWIPTMSVFFSLSLSLFLSTPKRPEPSSLARSLAKARREICAPEPAVQMASQSGAKWTSARPACLGHFCSRPIK